MKNPEFGQLLATHRENLNLDLTVLNLASYLANSVNKVQLKKSNKVPYKNKSIITWTGQAFYDRIL